MKRTTLLFAWLALNACMFLKPVSAATIEVTANIPSGTTAQWTSDNVYLLKKVIYVETNAVLRIEPGTVIKGAKVANCLPSPGLPNLVSALWVTRGGKLFAEGTAVRPIIFTAEDDDPSNPNDLPLYSAGLWGGVVLMGNAQINSAANSAGNVATPKYEVFEGVEDQPFHRMGGNNDADSSGVVKYVSIRYPGNQFSPNQELNGLTMGAVGSGTIIEHVEVFGSSDDGFEFFGGNVNTRYLAAIFCEDDNFDTDQGYRGVNQFWFALQKPGTADKGGEHDGDLNQANAGVTPNPEQPRSLWFTYNATYIGNGSTTALNPRDEAGMNYFNSLFTGFAGGVLIENDVRHEFTVTVEASLANNVFDVTTFSQGNTNAQFLASDTSYLNTLAAAKLLGLSNTNNAALDPRPAKDSPALVGARVPHDGRLSVVAYRGAFGPNDLWIRGWTAVDQLDVLTKTPIVAPAGGIVEVSENIPAGTVAQWTANNVYLLKRVVYVETNAVLRIEPGTVIKGAKSADSLATPGIPNLVSALWVTRGAKLIADGTADKPIVFTAEDDDVKDPNDLPLYAAGLWGGVVLMGNGQINSAANSAGNVASPKYEVFEGVEDRPFHRMGGTNDLDSSGVVRYVSIRYPGNQFSPNQELNGLTLGAVGSGTIVEHVEVFGSSDDGFEFFGGNVNTRYLAAIFCEDDNFDTDQGYRGLNQFWFVLQKPGTADKGGEHDGDLNQANAGTAPNPEQPRSVWHAYNATYIGNGTTTALNPRDEAGINYVNSVFTGFSGGILIENDGRYEFAVSGEANLLNNIFDVTTFSQGNTNATFLLADAARANAQTAAKLMGLSSTNNASLDPRPAADSPALNGARAPHDGKLSAVSYRGAFGPNDLWIRGWTAVDQLGVLTKAVVTPPSPEPPGLKASFSGGQIQIAFLTVDGRTYEMQASEDLMIWEPVSGSSIPGTGSTVTFAAAITGSLAKFYRIIIK